MTDTTDVLIFDHTALALVGKLQRLSQLIHRVHSDRSVKIFVPALCLAAAAAERPGLADHIGGLPAIEVLDLTYGSVDALGMLLAVGADWRMIQAVFLARPTPDWRDGRSVLTAIPDAYAGLGVSTIALN